MPFPTAFETLLYFGTEPAVVQAARDWYRHRTGIQIAPIPDGGAPNNDGGDDMVNFALGAF
jgi:hypothetical protein